MILFISAIASLTNAALSALCPTSLHKPFNACVIASTLARIDAPIGNESVTLATGAFVATGALVTFNDLFAFAAAAATDALGGFLFGARF